MLGEVVERHCFFFFLVRGAYDDAGARFLFVRRVSSTCNNTFGRYDYGIQDG
jgi:hypothetical protein